MTIIDLFNNFWSVNRTDPMPPMCATMYFYLLHVCNIRRWINPFELRTRQIELELGLSRDTINDSRNTLKQRGLIDFRNGKGKAPAKYRIVGVKTSSKPPVVGVGDNKPDDKPDNKPTTNPTTNPTTGQIPPISIEDIKIKEERLMPPNPQRGDSASRQGSLDLGESQKPKPPGKEQPAPPTLEEVKAHFMSQRADKRLDDWETEAEMFYNNFTATGWIDGRGRRVKRWDSRANLWILEKEQKQKQSQTNGTQGKTFNPDRRGTAADGKAKKNWDATF